MGASLRHVLEHAWYLWRHYSIIRASLWHILDHVYGILMAFLRHPYSMFSDQDLEGRHKAYSMLGVCFGHMFLGNLYGILTA